MENSISKRYWIYQPPVRGKGKEPAKPPGLGKYGGYLVGPLPENSFRPQLLATKKDGATERQKGQLRNFDLMECNKDGAIRELGKTILRKDKKTKRGKPHKTLLGSGLTVITTLLANK